MRLPLVLLYHIVASVPADADGEERGLFVEPGNFEKQMKDLADRSFSTINLSQFAAALNGASVPPRSFLLTFDDAYAHVDAAVSPVLRRHGFSAVMFACSEQLGGKNTWDADHPNLAKLEIAGQDQLKAMAAGPWEVASHGLRHVDLRGLVAEQRRYDLEQSRVRLSEIVGKPVLDFAYPFGADDPAIRDDVQASGYRTAFTAWHVGGIDPMHLGRRPIRGTDSMTVFRLKTSGSSEFLYKARGAARALMGSGAV